MTRILERKRFIPSALHRQRPLGCERRVARTVLSAIPRCLALRTATGLHVTANWSMIAMFDGEFASNAGLRWHRPAEI
jgi:hypothetical protein